MVVAFRRRENRRLLQTAWELKHTLAPYMKEDVSVMALFESMPSAFPSDIPKEQRLVDGLPANLSPDQRNEALRRRHKKRLLQPRK